MKWTPGRILVVSNLVPKEMVALTEAMHQGRIDEAGAARQ